MPRFDKDYYKVLGLAEAAAPEEIRKAYRSKAKDCHPDLAGGDKAKEARFKEINEAHEVLSDPAKRAQYDRMRKGGFPQDPGGAPGGGFGVHTEDLGDLFGSFFDLGAMGRRASARTRRSGGEDTAFALQVPFETAASGGRISITLPKEEACGDCKGNGSRGGGRACKACGGSGMSSRAQGGFAFSRPCPSCMGRGSEPGPTCPACGGEGARRMERRPEVRIPAVASASSKVRLAGEGAPGEGGGPPGDCILELTVAGHPDFVREGLDVTGAAEIDFVDAILGTEIPVKPLHGTVKLKIPPGAQPGARLRLTAQGVEVTHGEPGDHYVRLKVRLPRTLTEAQKKALEAFRHPPAAS